MTNKFKADLVAVFHLSLIVLGILSLPLLFIFSYWYKVVFILIGLSVFSWIVYKGSCWVTDWENYYRRKHSIGSHYETGFIKHYLKKIFNIDATTKVIGVLLYGYVVILVIVSVIKFI